MPDNESDEKFRRMLTQAEQPGPREKAPSRLKARIYSVLIREQQVTGPLQDLAATHAAGHNLCIFERLVQIAPIGEQAKSPFFCRVCHARVLAENVEDAPIFWAHCPYVDFQKG